MIALAKILFLFFFSHIKNPSLSRKFLIPYDVTTIFNNTTLQETIDIAINHIFNHNPNLNIIKKNLKTFPFCYIIDLFNGKFHNQTDGVVVGSPLVPVVDNIFMGFYVSND